MFGTKIISNFYSYIKNRIDVCYNFIKNLPQYCVIKIQSWQDEIKVIHGKLRNLTDSNLELGIYHLYNQNLTDAIFRFKLVDKYFAPGDLRANYWLGWCYFLKNNIRQAKCYLEKSLDADHTKLREFLNHPDILSTVAFVPEEIWHEYRNIITQHYIDNFYSKSCNLPHIFIQGLFRQISTLPDDSRILELGSNVGILGTELKKRFSNNFTLVGVECSERMIDFGKQYYDKQENYNDVINQHVSQFLSEYVPINQTENGKQFDMILSLCGLSFNKDLGDYLSQIYAILKDEGYFAFCVFAGNHTGFSLQHKEFVYNVDELKDLISSKNFVLLDCKELYTSINNKYLVCICKKNNL